MYYSTRIGVERESDQLFCTLYVCVFVCKAWIKMIDACLPSSVGIVRSCLYPTVWQRAEGEVEEEEEAEDVVVQKNERTEYVCATDREHYRKTN